MTRDKPTLERFFRTLRESLLQHLPAYKGQDVYSRGKDVEGNAFYYVAELEQIIREWVGSVYHHTKHRGLCVPELNAEHFSPVEMFEIGLARCGALTLPARSDLAYEFLDVKWRTIQHYGVEINGQRYDGEALNGFRDTRSPYGGAHAGKWPFSIDVHDVDSSTSATPTPTSGTALSGNMPQDWMRHSVRKRPTTRNKSPSARTVTLTPPVLSRICLASGAATLL
jgi:hypothetical protein